MENAILAFVTLMGERGVDYLLHHDDRDSNWWFLYFLLHLN